MGGGINDCSGTIINNTIYGNRAISNESIPARFPKGGGILNCTGTIRNNVVWGNTAAGEPSQIVDSITPEYCCIEGWTEGGVGNLFTEPRFVDPEGGDYRLQSFSYLIDSGADVSGLTTDLDGNPRPVDSTDEARGDGSGFDIGAYEFQGTVPIGVPPDQPINISPLDGAVDESIGPHLESSVFVDPDGVDLHTASQWQMDDRPDFASPEYNSGTDIDHLSKVRAFGGALEPETEYFWRVRHLDSRLQWSEWSEPTSLTLEEYDATFVPNDFPTVQAAVDAASEGDTIVVRGGRYVENILFPGTNLHLRSVDPTDWEVVEGTVLDGEDSGLVMTFEGREDSTSVLEGFTLTKGLGFDGGAVFGNHTKATFRRNLFLENMAYMGGAMNQCDGLIEHNKFLFNEASSRGGALFECNGETRNNLFSRNTAGWGGAASDCDGVFQSNIATFNEVGDRGGAFGLCDGFFSNNVVYGNRADFDGDAFASCDGAIVNNTIYIPPGAISRGAMWACDGTIRNNIIYGFDSFNSHNGTPTFSVIVGNWNGLGEGNFRASPRFVDAENGDFRLCSDSPCIDAGGTLNGFLPGGSLSVDHDGKARPVRGTNVKKGDGSLYDIGAYEFHLFDNYLSDIDGNLKVNYLDLFEFEPGWHKETDFSEDRRNLNGDLAIDALDLLVLMNDWGVETGAK